MAEVSVLDSASFELVFSKIIHLKQKCLDSVKSYMILVQFTSKQMLFWE